MKKKIVPWNLKTKEIFYNDAEEPRDLTLSKLSVILQPGL